MAGFRARVSVIIHRAIDREIAEGRSGVNVGASVVSAHTGLPYNTARRVMAGGKLSPPTISRLLSVYGRDGETVADLFDLVNGDDSDSPAG